MSERDVIFQNIVEDMSEGVITVGFNGMITSVNPEAEKILERKESELLGSQYAQAFFEYEENDAFNQLILDAIYSKKKMHRDIVNYYTGNEMKQLQVTTSYLRDGDTPIGIVAVLSDLTELVELRDSIKAMKKIESLNEQLEMRNKLLSETFGRYLSDDIVKELLDTPDGLNMGGKKLDVSIMMSDLRGFTYMSGIMAPDKLIDMLNHYLAEMTQIIEAHGGTIIEFLGDGILALFGAPTYNDNHAEECVTAALLMEAAMDDVNKWNEQQGYPQLQMGIGINSGEVIVGNIGSVKRTKYGVMGLQVNVAGRIESYTVGGQILVSSYTCEKIHGKLITQGSLEISPKGVDGTLTVYNVTGIDGMYQVFLCSGTDDLKHLAKPSDVTYSVIVDKHIGDDNIKSSLVAISEHSAVLIPAEELKQYDNIVLHIGGDLFAKVTDVSGTEITIRFTSVPQCFEEWYRSLID